MPRADRRNLTIILNRLTIEDIQSRFNYTNWLNYINDLLPKGMNVDQSEVISVTSVMYLNKLEDLLKRTPKRYVTSLFCLAHKKLTMGF